jgi:hypothetical protein
MAQRDADQHFTGLNGCKIHTSRSHDKCSNAGAKGCDHQKNCQDQPVTWKTSTGWTWGDEWESHHVLCISCVNRYMVLAAHKADRTFIDNCYLETAWCINQEPNLIALPMKLVYQTYPKSLTLNLPCHDWDHNNTGGYTDEVTEQIHLKVWQKLKQKNTEKPCDLAKSVVVKELVDLAADFKKELGRRGNRPVGTGSGTKAAWDEVTNPAKPVGKRAANWWFSFSMASDAIAGIREPAAFGNPTWASAAVRLAERVRLAAIKDKG